jgi:arsenate reductase (thioredoxin)
MNTKITDIISQFSVKNIPEERKETLQPLIDYIQSAKDRNKSIRLNFICTHNSRRSHLSQIWAQTMAHYFSIKNVFCYSGGTEATAMFPKITETLSNQGFEIQKLSDAKNPIYAVKYDKNENAIICFSKTCNNEFNPKEKFAAVMTCDSADEHCPIISGAEARFPIKYNDPKAFDNTTQMDEKYTERSLEIGQEMWYVFSKINNSQHEN